MLAGTFEHIRRLWGQLQGCLDLEGLKEACSGCFGDLAACEDDSTLAL